MAVRIKFDRSRNVIQPTFVLATRNGTKLGVIKAENIEISDSMNTYFELNFRVQKEDNGVKCTLWDQIEDFKLLWCRQWDVWFEIYVETSEANDTVKHINAISVGEAELSQTNLYGIEINTENDIAREDYDADYPTILYRNDHTEASLLHRIMEKVPNYTIKHVDVSIASIQRTFSFDGISLYDAFQEIGEEINCIFVINSGTVDGKIAREISVYDLESYCLDCGHRDTYFKTCPNPKCTGDRTNVLTGYGQDTTIFISTENLADDITYTTDKDSVKNCFRLEGGDDLMTATIMNCNPNGSAYIWYISDVMRRDMPKELTDRLETYDTEYDKYQNKYEIKFSGDIVDKYNALVEDYHKFNEDLLKIPETIVGYPELMTAYYNTIDFNLYLESGLMPNIKMQDTNADLEISNLRDSLYSSTASVQNLRSCSDATATSAVLSIAKVIVNSRYQVKIKDGVLEKTTTTDEETGEEIVTSATWTGTIVLTNYSDEEDTAFGEFTLNIDDNYEEYVKQKLEKALNSSETDETSGIVAIFDLTLEDFKAEIKKYCLHSLESFRDACQACLDILIEQGVADESSNLYEKLYLDYYYKNQALIEEIALREEEIAIIVGMYDKDGNLKTTGMQNLIEEEKFKIQEILNFQNFLGEELWLDFIAYRREDTYQNNNYISDGLNNKEIFDRALEFIEVARKEIYKSSTLQHSITATLKNLLVMKEFEPIIEYFSVGNWIRVRINDEVFRLRLISYTIDFDNLNNISIEFSDVLQCMNGVSDVESILNQAEAMTGSYDSVKEQASQGNKGKEHLDNWVKKGLALTNMKIISDSDNQNITWDSHGLLFREYIPETDTYDDRQMKAINRGLYLTDDNWLTSKAGIGNFVFWNPMGGEDGSGANEEAYGVIAETLVGNLILSEKVGIYNTKNSITLDENGLIITTDYDETNEDSKNNMAFTIQKRTKNADGESIEKLMYIDDDGNLVLNGSIRVNSSSATSSEEQSTPLNDVCDPNKLNDTISTVVKSETDSIYGSIDEQYDSVMDDVDYQLKRYKAEVGQYMQFDENGLTLGATTSPFRTVIDNRGVHLKQGYGTAAYINHNQLYINNAIINRTLVLGKFFFTPREDGGISLTWQGEIETPKEVDLIIISPENVSVDFVDGYEKTVTFTTYATTGVSKFEWHYQLLDGEEGIVTTEDETNDKAFVENINTTILDSENKTIEVIKSTFTYTVTSVDDDKMTVYCTVAAPATTAEEDTFELISKKAYLTVSEKTIEDIIIVKSYTAPTEAIRGENFTCSVEAESTTGATLSYQWYYNNKSNNSYNSSFSKVTSGKSATWTHGLSAESTVTAQKVYCEITDGTYIKKTDIVEVIIKDPE